MLVGIWERKSRRANGDSDDVAVVEREKELTSTLQKILIEVRALPPIILGSGRSSLADKFKAGTRLIDFVVAALRNRTSKSIN